MPSSVRASVVFPLPDSPTSPSVSPGQIAALTSVSACTSWPRWLKTFVSSSSSTSGALLPVDRRKVEVCGFRARKVARPVVVPAAALVPGRNRLERRLLHVTALVGERAAIGEHAAGELAPSGGRNPGIVSSRP